MVAAFSYQTGEADGGPSSFHVSVPGLAADSGGAVLVDCRGLSAPQATFDPLQIHTASAAATDHQVFVGSVRNGCTKPVSDVQLSGAVLDASGRTVGTFVTQADLRYAPAGMEIPFTVVLPENITSVASLGNVQVSRFTLDPPGPFLRMAAVITSFEVADERGGVVVDIEATNTVSAFVRDPSVLVWANDPAAGCYGPPLRFPLNKGDQMYPGQVARLEEFVSIHCPGATPMAVWEGIPFGSFPGASPVQVKGGAYTFDGVRLDVSGFFCNVSNGGVGIDSLTLVLSDSAGPAGSLDLAGPDYWPAGHCDPFVFRGLTPAGPWTPSGIKDLVLASISPTSFPLGGASAPTIFSPAGGAAPTAAWLVTNTTGAPLAPAGWSTSLVAIDGDGNPIARVIAFAEKAFLPGQAQVFEAGLRGPHGPVLNGRPWTWLSMTSPW